MITSSTPPSTTSLAERVLGIANRDDPSAALAHAHFNLTGEVTDAATLRERAEDGFNQLLTAGQESKKYDEALYEMDVEFVEGTLTLYALAKICQGEHPTYATLLTSWPLYQDMYTRLARPQEATAHARQRNALLLGSMSTISSAAFAAFSEDVLHANPHIIDQRSSAAKRRFGTFVTGNALDMPSDWTNTMDVIQADLLIHMLTDKGDQVAVDAANYRPMALKLFKEMFRVTGEGGHVLLRESPPGFDYTDRACESPRNQALVTNFESVLHETLKNVGFTDIAVEPAWELDHRMDYLFDPGRRFDEYAREPVVYQRSVYAYRP
jgi:SAM-dependent methyltransferase